jgi:hypothetical protein
MRTILHLVAALLTGLLALAGPAAAHEGHAHARPAVEHHHVIATTPSGTRMGVSVWVQVGPGQDVARVARNGLRRLGFTRIAPIRALQNHLGPLEDAPFALLEGRFKGPMPIFWRYNPQGERVAAEQAVIDALQAWTDVDRSTLAFAFGGQTQSCASLLADFGCNGRVRRGFEDGENVVAWEALPANVLGVATIRFGDYAEMDVLLNRLVASDFWLADCDSGGTLLSGVILHELGHTAGLDHVNRADEVMNPVGGGQCGLGQGDADGVRFLYPELTATVTGTVVHGPTGVPLEGVFVHLELPDGPVGAASFAVTAADGSFSFVVPGSFTYAVALDGTNNGYAPVAGPMVFADEAQESLGTLALDGPVPLVILAPAAAAEGGTATFTVQLAAALDTEVSVDFGVGGDFRGPTDFAEQLGTLVFVPGDTEEQVSVAIPQDGLFEPADTVSFSLSDPVGPAAIANRSRSVPIADDDPVALSVGPASAGEGGVAQFTVTVTGQSEGFGMIIAASTRDGSARSGEDYALVQDFAFVGPGGGSATIAVALLDDLLLEGDETFTLVASVGQVTVEATGTILDDERPPDTLAPSIDSVLVPAPQARYLLGDEVLASFGCTDEEGGSGIASCFGRVGDGPEVFPGEPLDTSTRGLKTLTINAFDQTGNGTFLAVTYEVVSRRITGRPIQPSLDCVTDNADGTHTAFFSYRNPNTAVVTIAVGPRNRFSPQPEDRGQPTVFERGGIEAAFSVTYSERRLVWRLNGRSAEAQARSPRCPMV